MTTSSIPLRVLVCDDELMARKRVLRLLGELGGIEATVECESGEQVLARLREDDVDVAILDVNMPGIDGFEAARRIREVSDTYVIMISAFVEDADAERGRLAGADEYLGKPFRPRELRARLEMVPDRRRRPPQA